MRTNLVNGLSQEGVSSQAKAVSFQPDQIFFGRITKLFPNGIAALQVGSQKIIAQLEAPLEANKPYWFQVLPGEGKIRLKVIGNVEENGRDSGSLTGLLKELSIPVNAENKELIQFFLKEHLPVSKQILQLTADLLKESSSSSLSAGMEAVKSILNRQLPLTSTSFNAVLAVLNDEPFSQNLEYLNNLLQHQLLTTKGDELENFIQTMLKPEFDIEDLSAQQKYVTNNANEPLESAASPLSDRSQFLEYLKGLMQKVGFSYEHDLIQILKQPHGENLVNKEVLKPLLIDFLQESPSGPAKETAEKMLHKITGFQILAQELGPIQQFVVQVPILLWEKSTDLTIQWSGRKDESGNIDPAFCRVLFYLELQNLKETIVDMQVQNRIMKIMVINENQHLQQIASPFLDQLKEGLRLSHFTLSAVQFIRPADPFSIKGKEPISTYFGSNQYSGVDIRI